MSPLKPSLPRPPQTGSRPHPPSYPIDQSGLWSQLLAVFRDIGGSFDPFANDAHPHVRALGRIARQRRPSQVDDYLAIGDLCAQLTLQNQQLNGAYAAKTIAAYIRGAELGPSRIHSVRQALVAFALWIADVARALDDYESLKVGVLICERVQQVVTRNTSDVDRLRDATALLQQHISQGIVTDRAAGGQVAARRESELLCDQGQMLLRQSQPSEALAIFERALVLDHNNQTAWLWQAMALTDLGRFDAALASYDHALTLAPHNARIWNSKGALLLELDRVDLAVECFERALELPDTPALPRAAFWLNRGKALFRLARYAEALDALTHSHEIDPSSESAAGIAACHAHLDNHDIADVSMPHR